MIKQSILIAALTVFVSSLALESANAQIFQPCGTCATFQRPILFPRLRAAFRSCGGYSCGLDLSANRVEYRRGACSTGASSTGTCSGGTCTLDEKADELPPAPPVPNCDLGTCSEYVPTKDGNVPVRERKTAGWLRAVNRTRAAFGRSPLQSDENLDAGSEYAANHCATVGGLDHTAGNEILAYNSSGIEVAIQSWLNSPAHRAYLLSSSFTFAGVSVVRDRYGRVWCAMRFR